MKTTLPTKETSLLTSRRGVCVNVCLSMNVCMCVCLIDGLYLIFVQVNSVPYGGEKGLVVIKVMIAESVLF